MAIKNVIFDFFDVFYHGIWYGGAMGDLAQRRYDIPRDEMSAYMDREDLDEYFHDVMRGKPGYSEAGYWEVIVAEAGWSKRGIGPMHLEHLAREVMALPVQGMRRLAEELAARGDLQMVLLSDISEQARVALEEDEEYRWLDDVFQAKYYSCELGRLKRDPGSFEYVLYDQGWEPSETLFVDDYAVNIEAAAKLGLSGVQFTSARQLKDDLIGLGIKIN